MQYAAIKEQVQTLAKDKPVTLVCVSKYRTVEEIRAVYAQGQRDFGENKVQDLIAKAAVLPQDIRWHLLGHLQTNKVKAVIDKTTLIHSLDSLHLAQEIQKQAERKNLIVKCLVQVNSTGIPDRYGVDYKDVNGFITAVSDMPNIELCGMMGMAPQGEDPTPYFEALHRAYTESPLNGKILSMGMSGDFKQAIACGSTMVRIGRIIFE